MSSEKKRLIIGLAGFVSFAIAGVVLIAMTGGGPPAGLDTADAIKIICGEACIAIAVSFLAGMFFGYISGLIVAGLLCADLLIMAAGKFWVQDEVIQKALRCLRFLPIAATTVTMVVFWQRMSNTDRAALDVGIESEQNALMAFIDGDSDFRTKARVFYKSVFVQSTSRGAVMQLVKTPEGYLFHPIGTSIAQLEEKGAICTFDGTYPAGNADFCIDGSNIEAISAAFTGDGKGCVITFTKTDKTEQQFVLACRASAAELNAFFGEGLQFSERRASKPLRVSTLIKLIKVIHAYELLMAAMLILLFPASILGRAVFAAVAALCGAMCVAATAFFIVFKRYFFVGANDSATYRSDKSKVNISVAAILPPLILVALVVGVCVTI